MSFHSIREEHFLKVSGIFRLLSSPTKLKLINYISFSPRTVEDCAKKLDQSVQNVSLHLIALAKAGILQVEQVKNFRYYSLSSDRVSEFVLELLQADRESLLEEEQIFSEPLRTLKDKVRMKKSILIDLRDFDERNYLPVGIAVSFPHELSSLKGFLKQFSDVQEEIVFLCKGKMCERLAGAVKIAEEAKFKTKALAFSAKELKDHTKLLN